MTSGPSSNPALPMITPSVSGLIKRLSQGDLHSLRLCEFATDGRATIRPEEDWPLRRSGRRKWRIQEIELDKAPR